MLEDELKAYRGLFECVGRNFPCGNDGLREEVIETANKALADTYRPTKEQHLTDSKKFKDHDVVYVWDCSSQKWLKSFFGDYVEDDEYPFKTFSGASFKKMITEAEYLAEYKDV